MTQEETHAALAQILAPIVEKIIEVAPEICDVLVAMQKHNGKVQ